MKCPAREQGESSENYATRYVIALISYECVIVHVAPTSRYYCSKA